VWGHSSPVQQDLQAQALKDEIQHKAQEHLASRAQGVGGQSRGSGGGGWVKVSQTQADGKVDGMVYKGFNSVFYADMSHARDIERQPVMAGTIDMLLSVILHIMLQPVRALTRPWCRWGCVRCASFVCRSCTRARRCTCLPYEGADADCCLLTSIDDCLFAQSTSATKNDHVVCKPNASCIHTLILMFRSISVARTDPGRESRRYRGQRASF